MNTDLIADAERKIAALRSQLLAFDDGRIVATGLTDRSGHTDTTAADKQGIKDKIAEWERLIAAERKRL